ncbi:prepilin peptidase dependent protein C [Nicoletella semolina]|uniref:Prepilin peptidase dependent protein C n=1 Tax=Nicoletella semolina TaxID=271160 RepID=A0A4R2N949_9PAST|nr:DUF5374 domain-containing protein [Nicoletella semolina]MDH2924451.1 hypothetical protein [Nicoletella semolina]TCP17425.1 prepilin peptidase dependent protein C [Nicoletella semolina]
MRNKLNASSGIALLIAVNLFAILYLSYNKWQSQQNRQLNLIYQKQQALQIAENQIALKMANLPCERSVKQNDVVFHITCYLPNKIIINFPTGEVTITKPDRLQAKKEVNYP